jgi:hypothetical protein
MRWALSVGDAPPPDQRKDDAVSRYRVTGLIIAGSLLFSSTAAVASATPAPTYQPDPWAVLSVMSGGASAVAVCGAAAAAVAAQAPAGGCVLPQVDVAPAAAQTPPPQPIPVPPVEAYGGGGLGISPLLLGLVAVAAGVGLFFALRHHGNGNSPT